MVGGDDDACIGVGELVEEFADGAVPEPGGCDAAIGGLVAGQFAHHGGLGSCMGEHVDEVDDDDVEGAGGKVLELCDESLGVGSVVEFGVGEGLVPAISVELGLYEGCLVEVLAFFLVFVDPEFGEHGGYLLGQESGEDGIACVLGGRGQDGEVEALVDGEVVGELLADDSPLVVAQVVEDDEIDLPALVEQGEDGALEDVGAHEGAASGVVEPVDIVFGDELGKFLVGLLLLHLEHFGHGAVGLGEFYFPEDEALVDFHPLVEAVGVVDLHANLGEILLVTVVGDFGLDGPLVQVFLECKQYLAGIDGLDEVVGYLGADGLVHDILFLALGNHDDGDGRVDFLDAREGFESAESGHVLVEEDEVEGLFAAQVDGVLAVGGGDDAVAFLLKKNDVGLEEFHFVVDPQEQAGIVGG